MVTATINRALSCERSGATVPEVVKQEEGKMIKQTIQFATVTDKNNDVLKVGKSIITQPKTNFKGGSVRWYSDKIKSEYKK